MTNVIQFSVKAKADLKKAIEKGQTKAKTATTPASKQKIAEKIKAAKQTKSRLSAPGELARCRQIVGGDWRAAMVLYRIAHLWRAINPKLTRHGKEYLAMHRADWAVSAGLSESEMKNYALPRLRKYAFGIVDARQMGSGKDNKIWVHLDMDAYRAALDEAGIELKTAVLEGAPAYL